jgi:hypothetical protein
VWSRTGSARSVLTKSVWPVRVADEGMVTGLLLLGVEIGGRGHA